jgi:FixJ family two-component response regulator
MFEEIPTIAVIDDDDSVRRALARLLTASGYQVRTFSSATEFLEGRPMLEDTPGCLLLDVRMPELGGLELQAILTSAGAQTAIVFMTGHGDVQTGVKAMKSGAVDFLLKPFTDDELLDSVQRALVRNAEMRVEHREVDELEHRAAKLTRREKEVCTLVVAGKLNKQIAAALGTSEKTVKVHRSRVMAKMEAASLAELVRIVERLNRSRASANAANTASAANAASSSNGAGGANTVRPPSPDSRREPNDSHDDERRRLSGSTG